jgi:uncharacterized protein YndB with AHSA1/START domain
MKNSTTVERKSDREVVVTRMVNAPVAKVYRAWTQPELFRQWWVPKSAPMKLVSFEMDVRVGGGYRLVFDFQGHQAAFFGTYKEVVPESKIVWSNDEAGDAGQTTTVTFEALGDKTRVVLTEVYPTKAALDEAMSNGSLDGLREQFDQLEEFVQPS